MKKLLLIALSTFAASANAWEPTFYLGGNYSATQFEPNWIYSNFTIKSLEGVAGVQLLDYLSVEGRIGAGLGEDKEFAKLYTQEIVDDEGNGTGEYGWVRADMTAGVKYYGSFYLKPHLSNEKASFYALIGYTSIEMDLSVPAIVEDESEADVSYGIGATFRISEDVDFVMEWKKIINAGTYSIRGGAIGFNYRF